MSGAFRYVDDESVGHVTQAARGALILGKDDCDSCASYEADVRRLQEQGVLGDELVIGKLMLTQPGCRAFKRENPWLRDVTFLPYTVLYSAGERVDEFASSRGSYLLERASDVGFL
jgi:hypothetical protein